MKLKSFTSHEIQRPYFQNLSEWERETGNTTPRHIFQWILVEYGKDEDLFEVVVKFEKLQVISPLNVQFKCDSVLEIATIIQSLNQAIFLSLQPTQISENVPFSPVQTGTESQLLMKKEQIIDCPDLGVEVKSGGWSDQLAHSLVSLDKWDIFERSKSKTVHESKAVGYGSPPNASNLKNADEPSDPSPQIYNTLKQAQFEDIKKNNLK